MTARHEDGTPGARGQMKASHADRERTIDTLKAGWPRTKRRDKAGSASDGLPPVTDVAGYPGIPGRW